MPAQPESDPAFTTAYYAFKYLPVGAFVVVFAMGVLDTDNTGRSPFMERGSTMCLLGLCVGLIGLHNLLFAKRVVQQQEAMNMRLSERFPPLRRLLSGWGDLSAKVRFTRAAGAGFILLGLVLCWSGLSRW